MLPYTSIWCLQCFFLSLYTLLGHLGQFPLLFNFHSLLSFAFAVQSKAENRVALYKGVEMKENALYNV